MTVHKLWPSHCMPVSKVGKGLSHVVRSLKGQFLVIDTQNDFVDMTLSTCTVKRWSDDKVIIQMSHKSPVKLSDFPHKHSMSMFPFPFPCGTVLVAIKELPMYLGISLALDEKISEILRD